LGRESLRRGPKGKKCLIEERSYQDEVNWKDRKLMGMFFFGTRGRSKV